MRIAIALFNLGGPDGPDAVEPFLFNLFNDADIVELPFGPRFQRFLAGQISKRRAPSVREKYAEIGGRSPMTGLSSSSRPSMREPENRLVALRS